MNAYDKALIIREVGKQDGRTQAAIARSLGVSQALVSKVVTAEQERRLATLRGRHESWRQLTREAMSLCERLTLENNELNAAFLDTVKWLKAAHDTLDIILQCNVCGDHVAEVFHLVNGGKDDNG